jgi:multisubunit Na+/H+ antiporter MnhC subunit
MYKKLCIALTIIFLITAGIFYLVTENLLFFIIYLIICLGSAAFLTLFTFRKYENVKIKYNECIQFINKFLISLSISNSLFDSFASCKEIINDKLYLELRVFDDIEARIDYLKKYYNYRIFDIFSGVLTEYLDKGGDVLTYSSTLMSEARRSQGTVNNIFTNSIKHLVSFITMWAFSFVILIVAKFSLNDFYGNFINNNTFLITIFIGFLFFIGTFVYYFQTLSFKKFIEEGKYEEN